MDRPHSKSPDPPDGALDIATGEDSQESATLQTALELLPNPQSQPDNRSPECHVTPPAPFISRPAQPDVDDLSVGFTFNKPSAVTPGQFSGRKHPKLINPIMGTSVANSAPGRPEKQAAARADPIMPTSPNHVQGEPTTVPPPRKKPPFEDYQPTCRAVESVPMTFVEAPVPHRMVQQLSMVSGKEDVLMQQSHQHHPASPIIVDMLQQKPRTSFKNDTSVSSAHPPRPLPRSSPRIPAVNRRPFRLNTPATRQRHSITRSNSKAKRNHHPVQTSSSSCFSGCYDRHDAETPSMQQHSMWTPPELLQEQFRRKLVTTATDLAGCFNDKFADIQVEVDQHLQTISDLKKTMSKQRDDMSRYKKRFMGKDDKIKQLEENCDQLVAKLNTTTKELDVRSSKISKLEEKCRSYKDFLNDAIAEQQELYKATKAKCDGTISQMRVEESKRNALQEHDRRHAEATREKLKQLVQTTVTEYQQKEREFNNQIEALNQRVQERDADILRERETAQVVRQQNGSITDIQETLKVFGAQVEEVVGKVNEVMAQQHQQDDQSGKNMNFKLDQIVQYLRDLDERTLPTAQLSNEMQLLNDKAVVSIFEKLEPILAAQVETKTSLDSLCLDVEACMNDIWAELEDSQTIIEEYCVKQDADRERRVALLQQEIEEAQRDLGQQNKLFLQSEQTVRKRDATIDKLTLEIIGLTQAKEGHMAESEHLARLREEHTQLQVDSAAKASLVIELQSKIQENIATLAMEKENSQKQNHELRKVMEQRVAEAKAAQVQAVEAAQQDTMLKINEIKTDIDAQLTQTLKERTALQEELDKAKQKIETVETANARTSEKAASLEEELQTSRAEVTQGKKQASLIEAEQQAANKQQLELVRKLQIQLASTQKKFNELASDARAYDHAAQKVLYGLKKWTQNYTSIQSMARELQRDENQTPNDIDPKFKPLIELHLLQVAVSQYCQAQKEAAQILSENSAKAGSQGFVMAAGNFPDRMRRVTVSSPVSTVVSPHPPSVQIEQERRRMGEQPKSILKLVAHAQPSREEEFHRELLKNTSMNRGLSKRLVAGRNPRTGLPKTPPSQRAHMGNDSVPKQGTSSPPVADKTKKRKQNGEHEPDRKRVGSLKKEEEDSTPVFSLPPKHADNTPHFESAVRAPRTVGGMGRVENEQPNSHLSQQQSQDRTAPDSRIRLGNLFKSSSHDPLTLFYRRRSARESQESFAPSQDRQPRGPLASRIQR